MQGHPLPLQVGNELLQAGDRLGIADPGRDPLVVLDLVVEFFALLAHLSLQSEPTRAAAGQVPSSARSARRVYPGIWNGDWDRRFTAMENFFLAVLISAVLVLIASAALLVDPAMGLLSAAAVR